MSVVAFRPRGRIPAKALAEHESELLAVARQLFFAGGFEGTSLETIARRARVSPKTIYARYGGKSGLFIASLTDLTDLFFKGLERITRSGDDPRSVLLSFAQQLLNVTLAPDTLAIHHVISAESMRFPEFAATFYDKGPRRGINLLASYLQRLHDAGTLQVADSDAIAQAFVGATVGELRRKVSLGVETPEPDVLAAHLRTTVDLFLQGLRPPEARRKR